MSINQLMQLICVVSGEFIGILSLAGGEIWWPESRCVELWGHPFCSAGGKSFTPVFTVQSGPFVNMCLQFLNAYFITSVFSFLPFTFFFFSPAGCPTFWPWQFTPAPGEGEERGVPHAPLHPPGLPVPAQGHDWGQPWKEAHGTRLCSHQAHTQGRLIDSQNPGINASLIGRLYPGIIESGLQLGYIVTSMSA